jgi:hypothetical protein
LLDPAKLGDVALGTGRFSDFAPIRARRRASVSAIVLENR